MCKPSQKCLKPPPRVTKLYPNHTSTREPQATINHEEALYNPLDNPHKLVTTKEEILEAYPNVFQGVGQFPGAPYKSKLDASITLKQTPCRPIQYRATLERDIQTRNQQDVASCQYIKLYLGSTVLCL